MKKRISFSRTQFRRMFLSSTLTTALTFIGIVADSLISGNFVGEVGLSAVNLFVPVLTVANFFAGIVGVGSSYLFCFAVGQFDQKRANRIFTQGLLLSVFISALLTVLMVQGRDAFIGFLGVGDQIASQIRDYWSFQIFCVMLTPLNYYIYMMVYSDGGSRVATLSNIATIVGNVIVSLILTPRMGLRGTSLGSFIGMALSTLILCLHFFSPRNMLRLSFRFSFRDIREMVSLSLMDSLTYICWGALGLILNRMIVARVGENALPISSMAFNILELSLLFDGVGSALTPVAEVYLGERNYGLEKRLVKFALCLAIVEGLTVMALLLTFAEQIPGLYNITDASVYTDCVRAVRIMALSMPCFAITYLFTSQYLLMRRVKLTTLIAVADKFVFASLWSTVFSYLINGVDGFWIGLVVSSAATPLVFGAGILIKSSGLFPFLVPNDEYPVFDRSFRVGQEAVIAVRNDVEAFLNEHSVDRSAALRVALFVEEAGMMVDSLNKNRKVRAEITVAVRPEEVSVIFRDDGVKYDLTDEDNALADFRSFVVAQLMSTYRDKRYLMTANYNRSEVAIPRKRV